MLSVRDYEAVAAIKKYKDMSVFNLTEAVSSRRSNQHLTIYKFSDGSTLFVYTTKGRMDASHPDWKGTAQDMHLGPVYGVPCQITK